MVEKQLTIGKAHSTSQNQATYETEIVDWRTAPNRVQEILKGRKFTFYPFARDDVSSQADGTATTFNTNYDLVDSPNVDGSGNSPGDNAVALVNGSEVSVASMDSSADTITLSSAPASGDTVVLLYPPSAGNVRVLATTPDKESGVEELLNEHVATFTRNNQVVPNTERRIDNSFILDEKWHLIIKLKADYTIAQWSDPTVQRAQVVIERLRRDSLSGKQKKEMKKDKQRIMNRNL